MKKTAVTVAATATVLVVSACGIGGGGDSPEDMTVPEQPSVETPTSETSVPPEDAPLTPWRNAPDIPVGVSEDAATATAQTFLEEWLTFSPANQEPKEEWFDSWEDFATREFRSQMRVEADGLLSWMWNQEVKQTGVDFPTSAEASVGETEAVAKVPVTYYVQPLFATVKELEDNADDNRRDDTYLVWMEVKDDELLVSDVQKVDSDASLPEVDD